MLGIQFGIRRLNATLALGLFFVYAASLGLTIDGDRLLVYRARRSRRPSCRPSAMFGGAALYGYTTKRSLASLGGFLVDGRDRA